ncbi:MAG: toxic anion resistance protein [Candidatus Fournierella pullistercoris]|uniref:Toxic anion resistance protein n=1 Tax=Candidatus Allofournierella pullistercoris TaxID=2838597 RepID=A0A948WQ71_9FIRM|nr:toxic anion resistance protein [Candidatus Fournierella pullistercoris]
MQDTKLDLDNDLLELDTSPNLTLSLEPEPEINLTPAPAPVDSAALAEIQQGEQKLDEKERKMVDEFAAKIDIGNVQQILQYGASAQKKVGDFSETALSNVTNKTKDLGEVGEMITDLVMELKGFDVNEEPKGIFGLFKRSADNLERLKLRYSKAEVNVDRIEGMLEQHQIQLMKDIALLDKLYQVNLAYYKELSMYILAGKKKLAEVRSTQLAQAIQKAKNSGLPEDAQAAQDLSDLCDRFDKKVHDLQLTRNISMQMAPQIRLLQNNDTVMVEKIQTSIVNTIPLWKNQMVLALGLAHSQQAIQAQRAVTDMTNELLKKNAATLKQGTIDTARESERGIVDIETLQQTNRTLIETLDELARIQSEGRQKRQAAEQELGRIETELKDKLLGMASR